MLFTDPLYWAKVAVGLIAYELTWVIYCRFFHPLRSIPGPFLASISRLWIVVRTARGDMEHTQRALHKKYGYLVRIAPNEIACSDPEALKIIYGTKPVFVKTDFYDIWAPPNNGYVGHFPARDEKVHSERRRIVNNVYSMSSILESEKAIDSCTEMFCSAMRDLASQNRVVQLDKWINMYAFDVLGELFYGKKFGFMQERKDVGDYIKSIETLLSAFSVGGFMPSYLQKLYLGFTLIFSPALRGALGAINHLAAASEAAVNKRKEELDAHPEDDRRDILRKMLDISRSQDEKTEFSIGDVFVESHSSLFAGADTTAIAIVSVLYYLMRNRTVYIRLRKEITDASAAGALSNPITYGEAVKLPFLRACVNEAFRLHPSVGLTMPRHVPSGGVNIAGVYIPAGYRVGINSAVVQYDKNIFGDDADRFNPDRWNKDDITKMERTLVQFGYGPRSCIGKNIALSEVYKIVPQLIREFDLELADPDKEWTTGNYWFNKQHDVNVHVRICKGST